MALRFVENYPLDKGEIPDLPEAGVCGKYFADSIVSVGRLPIGNACDCRGGIGKTGRRILFRAAEAGEWGHFRSKRIFFKKGLILLRFSVIIQHCMKYCCEEV